MDIWIFFIVNCDYCGHIYMAHQLEGNKDRQYSLFDVGSCIIMGCICSSYIDKIEKIDEELL
jgi:hypothetical protein